MMFNEQMVSATHDEIAQWINWFATEQSMKPEQISAVINQLRTFFQSGMTYNAIKAGKAKVQQCDNCKGKGTLGVILVGEDGPRACSVCRGAGKLLMGVQ